MFWFENILIFAWAAKSEGLIHFTKYPKAFLQHNHQHMYQHIAKEDFWLTKLFSFFSVENWKLFASKAEKWQLGKYNYSIFYHFKILKNKRGACKNDNFNSNGFRATGIYSFMQSGSFAVVFVWRFLLKTILLSQGAFRSFLNILV